MRQASIIIPCFDAEETLEAAVTSALAQTVKDLEVICVDDGSRDGTPALAHHLAEADERVRVVSVPNGGPGAARNTGIDAADGAWLVFLDADDTLEPQALSRIISAGEATDADVVVFRDRLLDAWTGEPRSDDEAFDVAWLDGAADLVAAEHPDRILNSFGQTVCNKAFRADLVRDRALRMEARYHAESLVFSSMALVQARRIALVDEELHVSRLHETDPSPFSREVHPLEFYHALLTLRAQLEVSGLWDLYHDSFANLAEREVATNLYQAPSYAAFAEILGILQREGAFLLDLGSLADDQAQDPAAHELCQSLEDHSVGEVFYDVFDRARAQERTASRELANERERIGALESRASELESRANAVDAESKRLLEARRRVWELQFPAAADADAEPAATQTTATAEHDAGEEGLAAEAAEPAEPTKPAEPEIPEPTPVDLAAGENGRVVTGARHHSRYNPDGSLTGALKALRYFFTGN